MQPVKIIIATHKPYIFPSDNYYVPIFVGKALTEEKILIQGDNTCENISTKNPYFCELTALYWAWKNHFFNHCQYVGLVHYRRYFSGNIISLNNQFIASQQEIIDTLNQYDVILPKKRHYYIETIYSHYKNSHFIADLDNTREIIKSTYSDYLESFDQVMNNRSLYLFNMFIMKKNLFEQYCNWLFTILFKLEENIDLTHYDRYQQRVFGFIAERLFNVWIVHHHLKIKEVKIVNLEKERLAQKAIGLLKRKFFIRK